MDQFIDAFKQGWPVIAAAPVISITLLAIVAAVVAIGVWFLRGAICKGQINGLTAQLATANERMELAREREAVAVGIRKELEAQLTKLDSQIASRQPLHVLTNSSATAETMVHRLEIAQDGLAKVLIWAPSSPEKGKSDY